MIHVQSQFPVYLIIHCIVNSDSDCCCNNKSKNEYKIYRFFELIVSSTSPQIAGTFLSCNNNLLYN